MKVTRLKVLRLSGPMPTSAAQCECEAVGARNSMNTDGTTTCCNICCHDNVNTYVIAGVHFIHFVFPELNVFRLLFHKMRGNCQIVYFLVFVSTSLKTK